MTKILFYASSPGQNVLGYYLTKICINLKKRGLKVTVISGERDQVKGLSDNLKINEIKHFKHSEIDSYNPIKFLNSIIIIRNILKIENIEVIHTNGLTYLIRSYIASIFLKSQIKIIFHIHSLIPFYMRNSLLMKIISKFTDKIITVCDLTSGKLIKMGLPKSKIVTIYNGIEIEKFHYQNNRNLRCTIGYLAVLNQCKGHIYFLEAAKHILNFYPKSQFLIIGDGPLKTELKNKTIELGLQKNVKFLGQVSNVNIPQIINSIDIGVSSSLTEQFPYSIIELIISGKPIVATDVGCIHKLVIDDETGYIVPPKDSIAFAKAIIKLINDPDLAYEMGKNGNVLVKNNFTMEIMIKNFEKAYHNVLDIET